MRFNTNLDLKSLFQSSRRAVWRQFAAAAALMVLVGACSSDEENRGRVGFVEGFLGGVAADEPRAALVGREVLSAGGSAVDAATAVFFALSVTLPSSAGLGGGGVCVVHDNETKTTEALEFLARAPAAVPPSATRPSAVPGNLRGFFALHAKYGRLRWSRLVSPAESLARFGIQVSRAFAHDMAKVEKALMADAESRRTFARPGGRGLVREGDFLRQLHLATVLARLRSRGPGDFYVGQLARKLVAQVAQVGGSLSIQDLRDYAPVWRDTIRIPYGNKTVHFAPPPAAAGAVEAQMWSMLVGDGRYDGASAEERKHLLAEVALRAYADRGRWIRGNGNSAVPAQQLVAEERIEKLMSTYVGDRHVAAEQLDPAPVERRENAAQTSFVVVDPEASAVACTLTMNSRFGTGRIVPGTGILLAALPGKGGRGAVSVGPMLLINHNVNEFFLAVAASGGVTAPTAMMNVIVELLVEGKSLEAAMAAKRVHHSGVPDLVYYEKGLDEAVLQTLTARGHRIAATPVLGKVNAIHCPDGIPPEPGTCSVRTDPRGFGLAASAE